MSPASTRHARFQARIAHQLATRLGAAGVMTECGVATSQGVRAPDVAWASAEFIARHGDATPLPAAPEICVEVLSPSDTAAEMDMKTRAYLDAGAVEGWLVAADGTLTVHDAGGVRPASRYGVVLALG